MPAELVIIGASLSLTGRFAVQGQQAHRGLRLWADDLNAAGGLPVRDRGGIFPVRLLVHDDASRVATAVVLAEQLIRDDRVDLLVGPYSSALALAVAPVAERHRRVLWNHGGSSDALADGGFRYVVNLLSPAGPYFVGLLDMMRTTLPSARRLALFHGARGTFPGAVAAGAAAHTARTGLELVCTAPYPPEEDEFAALVRRVESARPDLILGVGTTEADLAFARALRARRVRAAIGLVAAPIQLFKEALGSDADGIFGPSQWEPVLQDRPDIGPTSAEFTARFRVRFDTEPDYPAAQAYAAGLIAQRCVELAGILRDDALREAASTVDLRTFYGRFRLDPSSGQQIGHELVVVQWQGGQKRVVWPPAVAQAAPRW